MHSPLEAPYWAAGAKLNASVVGPTSLRLTRPTAYSRGGRILEYEFREDTPTERVLATLPSNETRLEVTDLLPETEYTFSVRARNEAELWSPAPLTVTVTTDSPDSVPTWPLGAALTADGIQETSLHLSWPAAVDNEGVTGYRVYQDGELLADLDAQKRGHSVQNLEIGRTYEFRIQAGDAAGNWSTDGPRATVSTAGGAPDCDGGLELVSVSSDETPGAGTLALGWTDDGQYLGRRGQRAAVSQLRRSVRSLRVDRHELGRPRSQHLSPPFLWQWQQLRFHPGLVSRRVRPRPCRRHHRTYQPSPGWRRSRLRRRPRTRP
ncbi:MAG: fibronectin type III domain-containing protein [Verrucomicrobiia bacterium]